MSASLKGFLSFVAHQVLFIIDDSDSVNHMWILRVVCNKADCIALYFHLINWLIFSVSS